MIIELQHTSTKEITDTLDRIHETSAQTTGRVLTLLVEACSQDRLSEIIEVSNDAAREHPSRVIVLIQSDPADEEGGIDAEVRVGGDAGAAELVIIYLRGEVEEHAAAVVTPLLLPDTPIVAWWPSQAPANPKHHPLGSIAQRRITDSVLDPQDNPLATRLAAYADGDSDLAWSRITGWRGIVAATLDVYPYERVVAAEIAGAPNSPGVDLAAGWLADRLDVPVTRRTILPAPAGELFACQLTLQRESGDIVVTNLPGDTVSITMPGRPEAFVAMSPRSRADCLSEELRHLDADEAYEGALRGTQEVVAGA